MNVGDVLALVDPRGINFVWGGIAFLCAFVVAGLTGMLTDLALNVRADRTGERRSYSWRDLAVLTAAGTTACAIVLTAFTWVLSANPTYRTADVTMLPSEALGQLYGIEIGASGDPEETELLRDGTVESFHIIDGRTTRDLLITVSGGEYTLVDQSTGSTLTPR